MEKSSRKKVEIPDKAWLEALKFLMGPQWLKMRFVSRQLADVVRGNISELPSIKIDSVKFWETSFKPSGILVASNADIPSNEIRDWFMKRGVNLNTPTDLAHLNRKNAFIGKKVQHGYQYGSSIYYYAEVNKIGDVWENFPNGASKRETIWHRLGSLVTREQVIFFADFNPDYSKYSWPSMEYFLNLIYNPSTYIKKVEMYALNDNLTDAFFLGEDYGSYIDCEEFTMRGDFSKSLPWIQRNVRAETIRFPGNYPDVENSYMEIINFVLNTPWKCARKKIQFGMVCQWKWFVKILMKKFRNLSTIEHVAIELPSLEFSFCEGMYETPDLNFLDWYLEVVKMKPRDVYVISDGRNRMEVAISQRFDNKKRYIPGQTKDIYDVSIKTYTIQSAAPTREKVYILNDTWLEALKFLKFPQWSKALFVSRQIAGVIQRNISRLPCFVVDSATMSEVMSAVSFVSFGDKIPENGKKLLFADLGVSLDAPANVQCEDAVIGLSRNNWYTNAHVYDCTCVEMRLRGAARDVQQFFQEPYILSAQLRRQNETSWAALKYFVKFLYYPAMYIKEVEMFELNQKIIDTVLVDEERFICCGSFTFQKETGSLDMNGFNKSLYWLERNVRANSIHFPEHIDFENENIYEPIVHFLLDTSWKCARQEVNFKCLCNLGSLVLTLIKKFRSVSFVRNDVPTLTASTYGDSETMSLLLLDPDVMKLNSDDSQDVNEYLISNGDNRMQIEILKGRKQGIHGCQDNDYRNIKYHDHGSQSFHIYVKVYTV